MLNETFFLDGVDARSVGIHLQNPIQFSEPVPIVKVESIPGRNGNIIYETGAFENRTGDAECFVMDRDDVMRSITDANKFLLSKRGYRRLETSDDNAHFWLARVENGARIEQRLRALAPFEISFDCKPQRFLKNGDAKIVLTDDQEIYNDYGFDALPLIAVQCTNGGSFYFNDVFVQILPPYNGVIYLDSETQNAYNDIGNQNNNVVAPSFPVLKAGANDIVFYSNIQKMEIIPRWWEL